MNKTEKLINQFLESRKNAWSTMTIKSCRAFLTNHGEGVLAGDANKFYDQLLASGLGKYTVQTYFIHASNFYSFVYPESGNPYAKYRKENRNAFKNSYKTKEVGVSYDEIKAKLEAIEDCPEKEAVIYLLKTAQRSSEAGLSRSAVRGDLPDSGRESTTGSATIIGKGGRERPNLGVDLRPAGSVRWNYYHVYQFCKERLGITPHGLRKLALTRAAARGAGPADLCAIAGWSSINTAYRYLQPQSVERLKGFLD